MAIERKKERCFKEQHGVGDIVKLNLSLGKTTYNNSAKVQRLKRFSALFDFTCNPNYNHVSGVVDETYIYDLYSQ